MFCSQANAWAGLDFKPKPRYHKLWSNAVNAMAIDAGEPGKGLVAGLGTDGGATIASDRFADVKN